MRGGLGLGSRTLRQVAARVAGGTSGLAVLMAFTSHAVRAQDAAVPGAAVQPDPIDVASKPAQTATGPIDGYIAAQSAAGTKTSTPLIETPQAVQAGTARVFFSVDRSGHVVSAPLAGTSGDAGLDGAAVAMMRRASPMPPPPELGGRVSLSVPVRFP